ncbi:unnamed protein product [Linum trigynum]|uniref:Uncharacterized protein n=1 Tax=Linum trigynum TaxID=586398 RepID=A0AAV2GYS6_9ROSI
MSTIPACHLSFVRMHAREELVERVKKLIWMEKQLVIVAKGDCKGEVIDGGKRKEEEVEGTNYRRIREKEEVNG